MPSRVEGGGLIVFDHFSSCRRRERRGTSMMAYRGFVVEAFPMFAFSPLVPALRFLWCIGYLATTRRQGRVARRRTNGRMDLLLVAVKVLTAVRVF